MMEKKGIYITVGGVVALVALGGYFFSNRSTTLPSKPEVVSKPAVEKEVAPVVKNEREPVVEQDKNKVIELTDIKTRLVLPDRYYVYAPPEQTIAEYSGYSAHYELQNVDDSLDNLHLSFVGLQSDKSVKSHYDWCGAIEGEPCMYGLPSPTQFTAEKNALKTNTALSQYTLIKINGRAFLVTNMKLTGDFGFLRTYRTLFGDKILRISVFQKTEGLAQDEKADDLIKGVVFEEMR